MTEDEIHYSIWVSPPPESVVYDQVSRLIKNAHKACPSVTDAVFQPHITVVGSFMASSDEDAVVNARNLARATAGPITVEFEAEPAVVEADKWNMVVVFWIDDDGDLLALHKAFGGGGEGYTPHMSLCYGCSSRQERVDLAKRMKEVTTLSGRCRFEIDSVELWKTEGGLNGVTGWREIDRFEL
ncbi:hypothetical protein FOZ61_007263 [Perkinsus olseni]|uniref:Cyclic phosphodiesterase n=1 Tax=Perkinsus olseni TaxID=32597 RepID=A0A7J6L9R4_PEROL|nr:hypothetical protein FOZ61_007263 [Perkinsus olseni]